MLNLTVFYEKMGYSTAIEASLTHAEGLVKIKGKWYNVDGGLFQEALIIDSTFIKEPV